MSEKFFVVDSHFQLPVIGLLFSKDFKKFVWSTAQTNASGFCYRIIHFGIKHFIQYKNFWLKMGEFKRNVPVV